MNNYNNTTHTSRIFNRTGAKFRIAATITLLGLYALSIQASTKSPEYNFLHYTSENGLASNCVRDIVQDNQGFMWFATDGGLNSFDGVRFMTYLPDNGNKRELPEIYALCLCMYGDDLLVSISQNIYRYDRTGDKLIPLQLKYPQGIRKIEGLDVRDMDSDTFGNLWITVENNGVYRIDKTMKVTCHYSFPELNNTVTTIYVDNSNVVWALSTVGEGGVYRYDRNSKKFIKVIFKFPTENKNIHAQAILHDSNGEHWLGTRNNGLLKFNPNTGEILHGVLPNTSDGFNHIHSITQYSPTQLLIGSDQGVALYDIPTDKSILYTNDELNNRSLSNQFVYPIHRDREGGFWIGTFYGGINYMSPDTKHINRYTPSRYRNSVCGNVISCLGEDSSGTIWIGSDDGGLCNYNPSNGKFTKYPLDRTRTYDNVHAVNSSPQGIWVGTFSSGAGLLNPATGQWRQVPLEGYGNSYSCYAILQDSKGNVWMAANDCLNRYDVNKDMFIRHRYLGSWTKCIVEDTRHRIWVGTQGKGLFIFNPAMDIWVNFHSGKDGGNLPNNQVYHISMTKEGEIYVATGNGVALYDEANDRFKKVNVDIPFRVANSVEKAGNSLWIATNNGLIRYKNDGTSETYSTKDGLVNNEFCSGVSLLASDGQMYLGSPNGLCSFFPSELKPNKYVPPIYFTGLEVVNRLIHVGDPLLPKSLDTLDELVLGHDDHTFSIYFSALSYANPDKNEYVYKLEGFDKGWIAAGKENRATYSNLPPGKYTLRVRAANNDGIWNEEDVRLKIRVKPVWYASWWMRTIYALLLISFLFLLYRRNVKRREDAHQEELRRISSNKEKEVYKAKLGFFTIVAHEIRTPVSLIIGPLEKMIDNAASLPSSLRGDLDMINSNARRLLSLVNQLLDFKKVEESEMPMDFVHVRVLPLIESVVERFKPSVKHKGAVLTAEYPGTDFEADICPEAFTKLVSNLLNNARKFTADRISLQCVYSQGEDFFKIIVEDNGIGIPKEKQERIFTPFYQVIDNINESRGGTGLGLSIVKNVAEKHGGNVKVESEPGKGSRFIVTLPVKQKIVVPVEQLQEQISTIINQEQSEESEKNKSDKQVMLVVDDNRDMLNYISKSMEGKYDVLTAENGREALEVLKDNDVAMIICDWMMPVMDGLTLLRKIRNNIATSHIPFIMLTAKTDTESKVESMKSGADAYVEKPFSMAFLEARVENLVNMRRMLRDKYSNNEQVPVTVLASHPQDDDFLERLNGIIEEHLSDTTFSVDILAEKLNISRTNLYSKLKSMADMTPNEIIQITRLKKGAELLAEGNLKVSEVSDRVGFNSPSYFTKCFQRQFGVKPGSYAETTK